MRRGFETWWLGYTCFCLESIYEDHAGQVIHIIIGSLDLYYSSFCQNSRKMKPAKVKVCTFSSRQSNALVLLRNQDFERMKVYSFQMVLFVSFVWLEMIQIRALLVKYFSSMSMVKSINWIGIFKTLNIISFHIWARKSVDVRPVIFSNANRAECSV